MSAPNLCAVVVLENEVKMPAGMPLEVADLPDYVDRGGQLGFDRTLDHSGKLCDGYRPRRQVRVVGRWFDEPGIERWSVHFALCIQPCDRWGCNG